MAERQAAYETQTETETEPDIKVAKNTETVAAKWTLYLIFLFKMA